MNETDHSHHLAELAGFFASPAICRDSFRLLIHFSIRLAALGHCAEVLAIVERSPEAGLFQPLLDGLRIHSNIPIDASSSTRELALQIAEKISCEIAAHAEAGSVA